jgi:hypothetical protein
LLWILEQKTSLLLLLPQSTTTTAQQQWKWIHGFLHIFGVEALILGKVCEEYIEKRERERETLRDKRSFGQETRKEIEGSLSLLLKYDLRVNMHRKSGSNLRFLGKLRGSTDPFCCWPIIIISFCEEQRSLYEFLY